MTAITRPYRYLNRDGVWPGFTWEGLELDDAGVLRLMALPRFDGALPSDVPPLDPSQPAAGIAVDSDGTIYFSNPASNAVYRVDGCSHGVERLPLRFTAPAGLLIAPHRRALYVADSENGRILIFNPTTLARIEVLTGFQRPVSLAADADGQLYVVDTLAKRVDQLTISGDVVASFWENVRDSGHVHEPIAVACDGDVVFVLDTQSHDVSLFDRQGVWIRSTEGPDISTGGASAFAACGGAIYVADPIARRLAVLRQNQDGAYVLAGYAAGYEGQAAALACDRHGDLLVLPGGALAPVTLTLDGSYRPDGWLRSGSISVDDIPHYWNRLHASIDLPAGSHVQFFVYTGALSSPPPPAADPMPAKWRPVGSDTTDFFIALDGEKTQALWIAAHLTNDLHATPALSQLRLDFDQESYLPYLPAIFRERECGDLLLRYISLFESFYRELEGDVDDLPALVDPAAAAADALGWLAGFLALPVPETWSEQQQRDAIAGAYTRYARRGTVAGLIEVLRAEAGVRAVVDEPIQAAGWWSMPGKSTSCKPDARGGWVDTVDSMLGFNTVLPSGEPQGAVVGTTAVFDRSQLITQEEYGTPLFEAVAYRFTVLLYPGDVTCAGKLDDIKAIVDREKPAHTSYEICVVEPGIRVGYRARLGIDTLVGHGPVQRGLGETALVLAGQPPSSLGISSRLGVSTHL